MGDKKRLVELIDGKKEKFAKLNDRIWEFAEIRFSLKQSADALCEVLEKEGFAIERGIAGMAHAFVASYGKGSPVIGILGEYDALAGMDQAAGLTEKKALKPGAPGHGCGHAALGSGAAAAAVGIKDYMKEKGLAGTIKYFGCPAEESGSGKAYLARAGAFNGLDSVLTWHPMMENALMGISTLANYQIFFSFAGRSAHAAMSPDQGRSALDAAELMNVGVNYLREHIIQEARIHYAYTDVGGGAPNVVQASAELLYFIRAPKQSQVQEIYERVVDIAKGAALMTGTAMSLRWDSACANIVVNEVLSKALYSNMTWLGPNSYTKEELFFAKTLVDSLDESSKKGIPAKAARTFFDKSPEDLAKIAVKPLVDDIAPYFFTDKAIPASSDVGDASWHAPTAQFTTACYPYGTVSHSWQVVSSGQSGMVHKGLDQAGKIIALTALDLLENPKMIEDAKAEYKVRLGGEQYHCPIPGEVNPEG
ncbi:amidohydrolase [Treponema primitia]|uniref:amidohydrolase n=1 Tax=Treponema primitia TaxID=88058 RepID=UPI0039819089